MQLRGIIVLAATDGYTAGSRDVARPASSEFGSGPRVSVGSTYAATLQVQDPLLMRIVPRHRRPLSVRTLPEYCRLLQDHFNLILCGNGETEQIASP